VRFEGEDWIGYTAESDRQQQVAVAGWRAAGFDIHPRSLSAVEQRDSRLRAERPGLYTGDGGSMLTLGTDNIPRAENRFTGSNRGSYSNPAFDRLLDIWNMGLDENQRMQAMVDMAKIVAEDVPIIPINYILQVTPHVNTLQGVKAGVVDIHLWTWAS
jgi:ABC-type transport system substrate-binding protein